MAKINMKDFFYGIYVRLGGNLIEVELGDDDYNVAFDEAVRTYRSYSANSVNDGIFFLEINPNQSVYTLPEQVSCVMELIRVRSGLITGGAAFEPFSAAFIQHTMKGADGGYPGIISYEAISQYQETINRMFGGHVMFEWDESTHQIKLWQTFKAKETMAVHCSEYKSIQHLLNQQRTFLWLQKYTEACVRIILGESYSKTAVVAGPQGGTSLKGQDLIAKGYEMKDLLVEQLLDYVDGGHGMTAPFFG